jgi:hypothetical protein
MPQGIFQVTEANVSKDRHVTDVTFRKSLPPGDDAGIAGSFANVAALKQCRDAISGYRG